MSTVLTMSEITCRLRDIQSLSQLAADWVNVGKSGSTVEAGTMRKVAALADELARRIEGGAMIQQ